MFGKKPRQKRDLTKGSVFWPIIILSIPLLLANALHMTYHIIDTFWVGKLGADAVAATTMSWPVLFIVTSVGMGLSIAGTILVGQYTGSKNKDKADFVATQTMVAMSFIAIILGILGYFGAETAIRMIGAQGTVIPLATSYLQVAFIGLVIFYLFIAFQSLMRGAGNVTLPLLIVFINVLLNFFLDPLFIFGFEPLGIPAYGVVGAAIVTLITQSTATLVGLLIMASGKSAVSLKLDCLKPCPSEIIKLAKLGFPSSIEFFTRAGSMVLLTAIVAPFGTVMLASYGLGMQFVGFLLMPAIGISLATSTLVSQNIGAKKFERVNKTINQSMVLSFSFLLIAGTLLYFFGGIFAGFFVPGDPLVIETTFLFIRIVAFSLGFMGIQTIIIGALRGAGNTKLAMNLSIFILLFTVALAYLLAHQFGMKETGVWLAYPIAYIVGAIVVYFFLKKQDWEKGVII